MSACQFLYFIQTEEQHLQRFPIKEDFFLLYVTHCAKYFLTITSMDYGK